MRSRTFPRRKPLTQMRSCRRSSFHVEGNSRASITRPPPRAEVVPVTAGSPAEREEYSEGRSAMANPLPWPFPLHLPALESKGILQGEGREFLEEAMGTACPERSRGVAISRVMRLLRPLPTPLRFGDCSSGARNDL